MVLIKKHKPEPLTDPNASFDDKFIQKEKLKMYIHREKMLAEIPSKFMG